MRNGQCLVGFVNEQLLAVFGWGRQPREKDGSKRRRRRQRELRLPFTKHDPVLLNRHHHEPNRRLHPVVVGFPESQRGMGARKQRRRVRRQPSTANRLDVTTIIEIDVPQKLSPF